MEEEMEVAQLGQAILGDLVKTVGTLREKDKNIQNGLQPNIRDSQTNQQILGTLRIIAGERAEPHTKKRFANIMNAVAA